MDSSRTTAGAENLFFPFWFDVRLIRLRIKRITSDVKEHTNSNRNIRARDFAALSSAVQCSGLSCGLILRMVELERIRAWERCFASL